MSVLLTTMLKEITYSGENIGNGPIYFYKKTAAGGVIYNLCNDADDPEVNLLKNTATYGNKYFSPTSDPNTWTTQKVKDGYDADPNDSLIWSGVKKRM